MNRLFSDTYALIEILKGNPNYEAYSNAVLVATEFNILELAYALSRDFKRDEAASVIEAIRSWVEIILPNDSDYLNASEFRLATNRTGKKKLSLVDALGYSCSCKQGIKFLTGDHEFNNMENVEYAK
jgi:predicted nucleic acid-binding protein